MILLAILLGINFLSLKFSVNKKPLKKTNTTLFYGL